MEGIFRKLTTEEEKDFRSFVDEDEETKKFIKKVRSYHPVVRDEIIQRIQNGI